MGLNTLSLRLDRLENARNGTGRVIVLKTGAGHTDDDVAKLLTQHGIRPTRADTVVCLRTIYMDEDGMDEPARFMPSLLSVA